MTGAGHARRKAVVLVVVAVLSGAAAIAACGLADGLSDGPALPDEAGIDGGGCDAELLGTVVSCGACGVVCPNGPNGTATCVDGGCAFACTAPFGDCDGKLSTGCETNLNTTRASCGKCGHDCLGGTCLAGQCQPLLLGYGPLAPAQIVASEHYIYGVNAFGVVSRVPEDGGAVVELVAGGTFEQARAPRIALANETLYYTSMGDGGTDGGIYALALDGGKPTVLAAADEPLAILANATYVTWSEGNGDGPAPMTSIKRCRLSSCATTNETLVPSTPGVIESLAADGASLYWANRGTAPDYADGNVMTCPTPACPPRAVSTMPTQPFDVVVDKTGVYWTSMGSGESGALSSCAVAGCSLLPTPMDTFQYRPAFVALAGSLLFWTNGDGSLKSINKLAAPPPAAPFTEHLLYQKRGTQPWALIVETDAVYYTDLTGAMGETGPALYKLAR